ncbi:MAG: hypothetical protein E5V72_07255 [Mesorhizobium sp.]|nr:hypothetical protein EOA86_25145 [Mesorhizobium sp. M5C.F.Ca.IN.020.32.2.1]TIW48936.1 MAG: hypothetical protein E5V72_07255 [Mesorhizobium sp.]
MRAQSRYSLFVENAPMHVAQKCAQRFWDNDMHKNRNLKSVAGIPSDATRFRRAPPAPARRAFRG